MEYDLIKKEMSYKVFKSLKVFIEGHIGIVIPDSKKIMLESRLLKRLKLLEIQTFDEYLNYFLSEEGSIKEIPRFVECITTNKTDFFREIEHFYYLKDVVLPKIVEDKNLKEIRLWSAASSTGEEAYTMGMFLEDFIKDKNFLKYKILATDISDKVLITAKRAIYSNEVCSVIPINYKKKYCLISKNKIESKFRIIKRIRDNIMFKKINLTTDFYNIKNKYHIIFLRNVMIYFNKKTQISILENLYKHLSTNGYLFLGHSEVLPDNKLPFKRVAPSVYVKIGD